MQPHAKHSLSLPQRFFPIENSRYEVKPGLRRFDGHVFQIDQHFQKYRQSKRSARAERLTKYFALANLTPAVERAVCAFVLRRLILEHPALFAFDGRTLSSQLTGDALRFSSDGAYLGPEDRDQRSRLYVPAESPQPGAVPPFASGLDALASQVQEDLAITSTDGDRHWLSAVHLCAPNHWSAEEKIGKSFAAIHEPVAGIEAINSRAGDWVRTMVNATGGLERFAWGITTDDELNHHPDRKTGRRFDPNNPTAFLRVERQTIWGFPQVDASLFTIRTSFIDCAEIRTRPHERDALISAIHSMSEDSLRYKGIDTFKTDLLAWL
jgi:dimethylamine monooxygenase subunit A